MEPPGPAPVQPSDAPEPRAPRPGFGAGLGRLFRLARKEVTEILRDRRTIVTLVLMPLLLYPVVGVLLHSLFLSGAGAALRPTFRLGFRSQAEGRVIMDYLRPGTEPPFRPFLIDDAEADVRQGLVDLAFRPKGAEPVEASPDRELAADWELLYREDSPNGREALAWVQRLCGAANADFLAARLQSMGIRQRPDPVRTLPVPLRDDGPGQSLSLAALVPLMLILMTITGAVYPAIDLTAGERERGTLDILVAAPVPRLTLLVAKYVAVVTVAVLTALMNLAAMTATLWVTGLSKQIFGAGGLSPLVILQVFGLLLLFAAFFSAVLLVLTSFARSFKEAQAYLIPLMLVSLAPGLLALWPDLKLEGLRTVAPLLNIVLLARDLFEGKAQLLPAVVVVVSTSLYALAALALAARVFGAEAVLYSESGGWLGLFRRL